MKFLQFALAIVLFICLLDKPTHFYTYVHGVAFVLFSLMAFNVYDDGKKRLAITYLTLGLIMQPFYPLPLERDQWNWIEVVLGAILLITAFRPAKL